MEIKFVKVGNREILQIDDCRIVYRNFTGEGSKFNREGDRNFSVVIDDQDLADQIADAGWNVKVKPPRDEDDEPFFTLPVKVKFNGRGPNVYLIVGDRKVELDEDTIDCLDKIDIIGVDLDLRPYDWEVNGQTGRTAYLQAMRVIQDADRFAD